MVEWNEVQSFTPIEVGDQGGLQALHDLRLVGPTIIQFIIIIFD